MSARLSAPRVIERQPVVGPWDPELERNCLGLAMLGGKVPAWLAPEHFYALEHQRIYEAVQAVGGHVAKVNAYLREMHKALISEPKYLAECCLEADHALSMGWAIEWERLRELANQRALLDAMRRVEVRVRAGDATCEEARTELRETFRSFR